MSFLPPRPSAEGTPESPPPRGRHRLPFEVVVEDQRRRLFLGAGIALAEQGYAGLTVRHVIEAAGVSRSSFYANFDNRRDCILAAHRDALERLLDLVMRACASEREWPQKVRAAIAASFAFMAEEPATARLLASNAVAGEIAVASQMLDCNAHLAALLREGRQHSQRGSDLPEIIEEALIGALVALIGRCLLDDGAEALARLEPEIVQLVLTPYIGVGEAVRVAAGEDL
jgi:AcrR family transcriptional regulator